jgi:hypothetical protein
VQVGQHTRSGLAAGLLADWPAALAGFHQAIPVGVLAAAEASDERDEETAAGQAAAAR